MGGRYYLHPYAYSPLLGYDSIRYGRNGLEDLLDGELAWGPGPKDVKRGQDVTLTLDAGLTEEAYRQIKDFTGSVVVLDVKTGEILAMTSSPSYDIGRIEEDWEEINNKDGVMLSNAYRNPVAPGSVFKLVTSKAILEAGIDREKVEDNGFLKVNGQTIHNYGGEAFGKVDYREAFVKSSNVYFMDRALKLGSSRMREAGKSFMLGEPVELDFTTLSSEFDPGEESDNLLAVTAFGQGNTLVTPLQMAMITQSIANDGQMIRPWLIAGKKDAAGKEVSLGKTEVMTNTMDAAVAGKIRDAMTEAGKAYGMKRIGSERIRIAAKTGTAQRGDGTNNAWLVTFAPADDPRYVVVVNRLGTKEIGRSLKPVAESLYEMLFASENDSQSDDSQSDNNS